MLILLTILISHSASNPWGEADPLASTEHVDLSGLLLMVSLNRYINRHTSCHSHIHTRPMQNQNSSMFKSSSDQSPNFRLLSYQALPVREERGFQTAQRASCLLARLLGLFSTSLILPWQPKALTLCNVLQLTGHSDKSSHLMRECHLLAGTISSRPLPLIYLREHVAP